MPKDSSSGFVWRMAVRHHQIRIVGTGRRPKVLFEVGEPIPLASWSSLSVAPPFTAVDPERHPRSVTKGKEEPIRKKQGNACVMHARAVCASVRACVYASARVCVLVCERARVCASVSARNTSHEVLRRLGLAGTGLARHDQRGGRFVTFDMLERRCAHTHAKKKRERKAGLVGEAPHVHDTPSPIA